MGPCDKSKAIRYVDANPKAGHSAEEAIPGTLYYAYTDKGRAVEVWVPDAGLHFDHSYFCHGLTFGTYEKFGYTVASGPDVLRVLEDEYTQIALSGASGQRFSNACPAEEAKLLSLYLQSAREGSVVAWENAKAEVVHTARIGAFGEGARSPDSTIMMSKNGFVTAKAAVLTVICADYAKLVTHFRLWNKSAVTGAVDKGVESKGSVSSSSSGKGATPTKSNCVIL